MSIDLVVENAISAPQVVQDQNGNRSALAIGSTSVQIGTGGPGIVLKVSGNPGNAPLIEVATQSDEAAIRYVNNDGLGWHVGSGTGEKTFFVWNHEAGVVLTIAVDGTLTIGGLLRARTLELKGVPQVVGNRPVEPLVIDTETGEILRQPPLFP